MILAVFVAISLRQRVEDGCSKDPAKPHTHWSDDCWHDSQAVDSGPGRGKSNELMMCSAVPPFFGPDRQAAGYPQAQLPGWGKSQSPGSKWT